ncbi:hypothetical protein D1AOALGA4SA_10724 [Olavius algarvensis Delta 1 endosymbiont]|nr:hypothetical protein D1AOALGA4SA_10724 [Olavius algarvensis Delta 1 endosymbiont]
MIPFRYGIIINYLLFLAADSPAQNPKALYLKQVGAIIFATRFR